MISHELAMELWRRAARAEFGIRIPTDDVVYLSQTLYAARRAEDDEELTALSVVKVKGAVWIVKNSKR